MARATNALTRDAALEWTAEREARQIQSSSSMEKRHVLDVAIRRASLSILARRGE
jgi:hypothetical protein